MERSRAMRWLAVTAVLIIGIQLLLIVTQGEVACLNEGCRVVEGLTRISPFWFNLMGLAYFASLYVLLLLRPTEEIGNTLLRILFAAGLGAEGVLLGYQIVVAKTFCSYCLFIFSMVAGLNLLAGVRHATICIAGLAGALTLFPLLRFGPEVVAARKLTLTSGTYGTLRAIPTGPELYLFFSETCEHCRKVIQYIPAESRCTIHFNPIGAIDTPPLPGLEKPAEYAPEVNRAMLAFLDIGEIPLLIERNHETFRLIKGEKAIISFLAETCTKAPSKLMMPEPEVPQKSLPEEGECSINLEHCATE